MIFTPFNNCFGIVPQLVAPPKPLFKIFFMYGQHRYWGCFIEDHLVGYGWTPELAYEDFCNHPTTYYHESNYSFGYTSIETWRLYDVPIYHM